MDSLSIDLTSLRATKAKLGRKIGRQNSQLILVLASVFIVSGLVFVFIIKLHYGYLLVGTGLLMAMLGLWVSWDLLNPKPIDSSFSERLSSEVLAILKTSDNSPKTVYDRLSQNWQNLFLTNHLFISSQIILPMLSERPEDLTNALDKTLALANENNSAVIGAGLITAGIMMSSPVLGNYLTERKQSIEDIENVTDWLVRLIKSSQRPTNHSGGIGRDWSFGFTNFLNRFAHNISQEIERHGSNFGWLTTSDAVIDIEKAVANHGGAVAVIGPPGIGKTSRIYALAQRMIEGIADQRLAFHQVLKLEASTILSAASRPGSLEAIFNKLISEAAAAGHVILFLDDAELFFKQGVGSLNASAILQPILEARAIPIILTLTPQDYQRLRANNPAISSLITTVVLNELPQRAVMNILEDSAGGLEHRFNCLITYSAIKAAYSLSGRYDLEEAYPGKAIKLLERSISFGDNHVVSSDSVEMAIEQAHGVKVSSAKPAEAKALLNLEEQIHQRMINQTAAVKAVASSLRRARAGIGDPKRPIGSFLFLGPTGVGKTELAKAIAATYFKGEQNIIRLDMSEYQQDSDVGRLLAAGNEQGINFLDKIRQQPFSVVLLDEIEKAHPNILNLLLQLLDEGRLSDTVGRSVSFRDSIVIATSNAGANSIIEHLKAGGQLEEFKQQLTDQLINDGTYKPELLNRFDEVVLFRSLNPNELVQVVILLLKEINANLTSQNITVELSDKAIEKIVQLGSDIRYGARPMRRALQRGVEDSLAKKILTGEVSPGSKVRMEDSDIEL